MKIRFYDPSGRIEFLDVMKGIGILLLLLSHSISGDSLIKTWIFSFHMPLFFWCTGYLIAIKNPSGKELQGKLGRILAKKALAILVPYVVFSFLIILYQVLLQLLHSHTFDLAAFIDKLMRIIQLMGMESLWFLPCLLLAELLFFVLHAYFPRLVLGAACLACVVLNFVFNNTLPTGILGVLIRSTTGFVFVCFGYLSYILSKMQARNKKLTIFSSPWTSLLLMILGAIISLINGFAAIGSYDFGFVPFFYISAFLTLEGLCGLCKVAPKLQIIPFFGKNSIVVLCTNNIIIEILRLLDSKLGGNFFLFHGMVGTFLFAILLALIEFPIIVIGMKYFKYFFGVLPKERNTFSESEKT